LDDEQEQEKQSEMRERSNDDRSKAYSRNIR
jgi:hypothetical protein